MSALFCGCFDSLSLGSWYKWISDWREVFEIGKPKGLLKFNQTLGQNLDKAQNEMATQFSDLPVDVLKLIIERTTLDDRPRIRGVSRLLRDVSDSLPFEVEQLKFRCDFFDSTVYLGNRKFHYRHGVDHAQPALNQLYLLMSIPNLRLNTLSIKISDDNESRWIRRNTWIFWEFDCLLASLQTQIPVRNLSVRWLNLDLLQLILPILKPGTLQSITSSDLEHDYFDDNYRDKQYSIADVEKISRLKQWKLAKELTMSNCLAATILVDTKECFSNFKVWKLDAPYLDTEFDLLRSCMKKLNQDQVLVTPSIACVLFEKFCNKLGPNTEMLNENSAVYREDGYVFDVMVDQEMNVIITRRAAV